MTTLDQCKRCNASGPTVYGLHGDKTTENRAKALREGWLWVSVSCSACGEVHLSQARKRFVKT